MSDIVSNEFYMNPLSQCCGRRGAGWVVVDVVQSYYWHLICCPWCPSLSWFWTWLVIGMLLLILKDAQVVRWEKPVNVSNDDSNVFSGLNKWLSWMYYRPGYEVTHCVATRWIHCGSKTTVIKETSVKTANLILLYWIFDELTIYLLKTFLEPRNVI